MVDRRFLILYCNFFINLFIRVAAAFRAVY